MSRSLSYTKPEIHLKRHSDLSGGSRAGIIGGLFPHLAKDDLGMGVCRAVRYGRTKEYGRVASQATLVSQNAFAAAVDAPVSSSTR